MTRLTSTEVGKQRHGTPQTATTPAASRQAALRQSAILRFHAPVAATVLSYAVIFNIINAALARTGGAAATLAAFAVAQSLVDLFAAPSGMGNQWIVSRGRDRSSLRVGAGVMAQMAGAVTVLFVFLGWTPLGRWICCDVFGAPAHLYSGIVAVLRVCLPMPLIWALRNGAQAILMLRRQTHLMAAGVFLRLAWVWGASVALLRIPALDGAVLGGVLWITGMAVESGFLLLAARRQLPHVPEKPENGLLPTPPRVWRFLAPLIVTSFLWALGRPLINTAVARAADPETSIAAYQVAWFAAFLLLSLEADFRQAVVVFWTDKETFRALSRFGLWLGCGVSAAVLVLGLTGGSLWFLRDALGAPPDVAAVASRLFLGFSPVPVLWAITELYVGRLLRNGTTGLIGTAKAANLAVMIAVMFGLTFVAPRLGPLVGVLGMVAGHAAELLVIRLGMRGVGAEPAVGAGA